jgi:trans-2,3-dihydro-3-hydroxyanthranilate isomerase
MSTGLPTLVLPIDDAARLAEITMDPSRLDQAMPRLADGSKPLTCYVVAEEAAGEWRARSFGTDLAGGEDPATGSAAGAFGAYLAQYFGVYRFVIRQGIEMGCPSRLYVDTTEGIAVSGTVQFVGSGTLDLP